MEKTLYISSNLNENEFKNYVELKRDVVRDTFSLKFITIERNGEYSGSYYTYSREEFEQLEKTIRILLN